MNAPLFSDKQTNSPAWQRLSALAARLNPPEHLLASLLEQDNRSADFMRHASGLAFDFTRQRITRDVFHALMQLAAETGVHERFQALARGETVNTTENRQVLHMVCRDQEGKLLLNPQAQSTAARIHTERERILSFAESVIDETVTGCTGKPFQDIVVIGIGGSHLGTRAIHAALSPLFGTRFRLYFLTSVYGGQFHQVIQDVRPDQTLFIFISKSFKTIESISNAGLVAEFMRSHGLSPEQHWVTISNANAHDRIPGDGAGDILARFIVEASIGGRYSVTSTVGILPLALSLGVDTVRRFLRGCADMDHHALSAPAGRNLPLISAMISVWNNHFLGYPAVAVVPYLSILRDFISHLQQLYMESNGKQITNKAAGISDAASSVFLFGEVGTDAQHSFFQLAHQGRPLPIEFIGTLTPVFASDQNLTSEGVTRHMEMWSNLLAQADSLALGFTHPSDPNRFYPGNRPSSILTLDAYTPETVGALLSFYEARTIFEGFVWGINPFDQFGVERGKTIAADYRNAFKAMDPAAPLPASSLPEIRTTGTDYIRAVSAGAWQK
ncbi:MAG: glucose-6-phosphate isomerase [Deltaproteobacteria bacterium]|nr:MAG: glucose-6-phosphate isomerase [Deltaproteobacteria bacterium]